MKKTPDAAATDNEDEGMTEEERAKFVKVRHGLGIQVYGRENGILVKYAGEWEAGQKHGDGHSTFADGSEYKGYTMRGVFNGRGIYRWPATPGSEKCHSYTGEWRDGKMNGPGEFRHADAHSLKGTFVNNLFVQVIRGKKYYLRPLDSKDSHKKHIDNCIAASKREAKQQLEERQKVRLFKCETAEELAAALANSKEAERTPVIVSEAAADLQSDHVVSAMEGAFDQAGIQQIYLRQIAKEIQDHGVDYNQRNQFVQQRFGYDDQMICQMLTGEKRGKLMLNFDELPEGN
jgi:hypothetical protein